MKQLTKYKFEQEKTIKPTDIPPLVFGGKEEIGDDEIELLDSYEHAFGFDRNIDVWDTIVGIAPFNRKCLLDDMVKHKVVIYPMVRLMLMLIQQQKNFSKKRDGMKKQLLYWMRMVLMAIVVYKYIKNTTL